MLGLEGFRIFISKFSSGTLKKIDFKIRGDYMWLIELIKDIPFLVKNVKFSAWGSVIKCRWVSRKYS